MTVFKVWQKYLFGLIVVELVFLSTLSLKNWTFANCSGFSTIVMIVSAWLRTANLSACLVMKNIHKIWAQDWLNSAAFFLSLWLLGFGFLLLSVQNWLRFFAQLVTSTYAFCPHILKYDHSMTLLTGETGQFFLKIRIT